MQNSIKSKKALIAFYTLLLFPLFLFAQQTQPLVNSTLDGLVIDSVTREPLPGATLQLEGVTHSTKTDAQGRFRFVTGQKFPYTIYVSYIGYQTKKVIANGSPIEVLLEAEPNALEDVVVVGYGTQRRKDFTGSLASVPASLRDQPVSSPERLLQGSVSGIQVTQANGQPGGGVSVRIRGGTSINAGSEPLYVIDGFPVYNSDASIDAGIVSGEKINPLSTLNAGDIESIDVLKDASATAIYGSRGANGVILITTKKGKSNESRITYNTYYGSQNVIRKLPLLNASQWGALKNDARTDAGKTRLYTDEELQLLGEGTDWQEEGFSTAPTHNHNLSIFTGTDRTRLTLGGNFFQPGRCGYTYRL